MSTNYGARKNPSCALNIMQSLRKKKLEILGLASPHAPDPYGLPLKQGRIGPSLLEKPGGVLRISDDFGGGVTVGCQTTCTSRI